MEWVMHGYGAFASKAFPLWPVCIGPCIYTSYLYLFYRVSSLSIMLPKPFGTDKIFDPGSLHRGYAG